MKTNLFDPLYLKNYQILYIHNFSNHSWAASP